MEINFHKVEKWNFHVLDTFYNEAGIYLLKFPNGMKYLGKSKRINRRIREHLQDSRAWHEKARKTYTKLSLIPYYDIYTFAAKQHPEWKRLTKKRKQAVLVEYEEYYENYKSNYYKMCCDYFSKVELWVWRVPEENITEAEAFCLNQIALEGKKEQYYNTAYPKEELK